MNKPKVSIIMPMYNAERYVAKAIDSILNQTFGDFELIVINDGSTDKSVDIVQSYKDPRIVLLENDKNMGLVEVRNKGIRESRGQFIAMLDSDDIAHKERLEFEVDFLEKNPKVGLVATWVRVIDESDKPTGVFWRESTKDSDLPARLLFGNCISQSSVMIRKSILPKEPYKPGFAPAEDYDLWVRISQKNSTAIIHNVLTDYRSYSTSTSVLKKEVKDKSVENIIREQLGRVGVNPTPKEYLIHRTNYKHNGDDVDSFIIEREKWLRKMINLNNKTKIYPKDSLERVVRGRWLDTLLYNDIPFSKLIKFLNSDICGKVSAVQNLGVIGKKILKIFV